KRGEYGAILFSPESVFAVPAFPLEDVFDPTGAGDAFAGGMVGHLAATGDRTDAGLRRAIVYGSVLASYIVEDFGGRRLRTLAAGIEHARGGIIISMDADLQNDPRDIPRLLAAFQGDVDVVNGWRTPRRDPWLRRRVPSALANRLISLVTGTALHDYGCTLRAMRASVARELQLYGELHRFIPALAADLGARLVEIPVHHRPRQAGRSKYGLSRTLRVLL